MGEIYYSTDEEWYRYTEINDAIDGEDVGTITIWQGESVPVKASDFIWNTEELLSERAYDEFGEYADMWPDSSKEQNDELNEMIKKAVDAWADKHKLQPTFYRIINNKELKINIIDEDGNWEIIDNAP